MIMEGEVVDQKIELSNHTVLSHIPTTPRKVFQLILSPSEKWVIVNKYEDGWGQLDIVCTAGYIRVETLTPSFHKSHADRDTPDQKIVAAFWTAPFFGCQNIKPDTKDEPLESLRVLLIGSNGVVILWNPHANVQEWRTTVSVLTGSVTAADISPETKKLAVGLSSGQVHLYKLDYLFRHFTRDIDPWLSFDVALTYEEGSVEALSWFDKETVYLARHDSNIVSRHSVTKTEVNQQRTGVTEIFAVSASGTTRSSTSLSAGKRREAVLSVTAMACSCAAGILVLGDSTGGVTVWNAVEGRLLSQFSEHEGKVAGVAVDSCPHTDTVFAYSVGARDARLVNYKRIVLNTPGEQTKFKWILGETIFPCPAEGASALALATLQQKVLSASSESGLLGITPMVDCPKTPFKTRVLIRPDCGLGYRCGTLWAATEKPGSNKDDPVFSVSLNMERMEHDSVNSNSTLVATLYEVSKRACKDKEQEGCINNNTNYASARLPKLGPLILKNRQLAPGAKLAADELNSEPSIMAGFVTEGFHPNKSEEKEPYNLSTLGRIPINRRQFVSLQIFEQLVLYSTRHKLECFSLSKNNVSQQKYLQKINSISVPEEIYRAWILDNHTAIVCTHTHANPALNTETVSVEFLSQTDSPGNINDETDCSTQSDDSDNEKKIKTTKKPLANSALSAKNREKISGLTQSFALYVYDLTPHSQSDNQEFRRQLITQETLSHPMVHAEYCVKEGTLAMISGSGEIFLYSVDTDNKSVAETVKFFKKKAVIPAIPFPEEAGICCAISFIGKNRMMAITSRNYFFLVNTNTGSIENFLMEAPVRKPIFWTKGDNDNRSDALKYFQQSRMYCRIPTKFLGLKDGVVRRILPVSDDRVIFLTLHAVCSMYYGKKIRKNKLTDQKSQHLSNHECTEIHDVCKTAFEIFEKIIPTIPKVFQTFPERILEKLRKQDSSLSVETEKKIDQLSRFDIEYSILGKFKHNIVQEDITNIINNSKNKITFNILTKKMLYSKNSVEDNTADRPSRTLKRIRYGI